MNSQEAKKIFALMKEFGVARFKTKEVDIRMDKAISHEKGTNVSLSPTKKARTKSTKAPEPQAIPPVEMTIPHHVNEVANLLKLSDVDLVDKLFPDYTKGVS